MCINQGTATSKVLIENERVRVTEWHFNNKSDGVLEIDHGSGKRGVANMQNGVPYFREAGVEHDVINANDFDCAFVEIELLES